MNEFAHIPNVILASTLFLPKSHLEALGRCAARFPSSEGDFSKADIDAVEIGEHHHRVLQAVCRGQVRKCEGDGCPPDTHTYIIAARRSGLDQTIGRVLPGARVVKWDPAKKELKGRKADVLRAIKNSGRDRISLNEVMERVGWSRTKNGKKEFKHAVRDDDRFQIALNDAGFREVRQGQGNQVWFEKVASL